MHIFNTSGRREYGLFYLDLIQAFERRHFMNPKLRPLFSMVGGRGKSMAADVMFHHVLDGLDPMDIIDGEPVRHMCLESAPKDAIGRELFAHGEMTDGDKKSPVSLMFTNSPDIGAVLKRRHARDENMKDLIITKSLKGAFESQRVEGAGGLVFASSTSLECSTVNIAMLGGAHDDWESEHIVYVNSPILQKSDEFRDGWGHLKRNYESRSVLENRR